MTKLEEILGQQLADRVKRLQRSGELRDEGWRGRERIFAHAKEYAQSIRANPGVVDIREGQRVLGSYDTMVLGLITALIDRVSVQEERLFELGREVECLRDELEKQRKVP